MFRVRNTCILLFAVCGLLLLPAAATARQNALAIFNLIPTNIEAMGYNGDILYALISTLEKEKNIELMPRREMEEILFHAGIVQGDNPEMILKAGKVLDTNFILFGQVTKAGQQIQARLKLMDIKKNTVVKTWTPTYSGREAILSGVPELARELSASVLKSPQTAAPPPAERIEPRIDITNFRAEFRDGKVVLKWEVDSSRPAVGFNLYRSETLEGPYQYHGKATENMFVDANIKRGRSYFYRVGVLLASGEEIKGRQAARIQSVGEKIPHPPLILESRGHIGRAVIKFVPSLQNEQEKFSIKEYKIYRQKQVDGNWENISTIEAKLSSQSELAFSVEDTRELDDGRTYIYAVASVDQEKRESPLSDTVSITTVERPVLTLVKDNLLRRTIFSWQPIQNVDGYYLYRQGDGKDWEKVGRINDAAAVKTEDTSELEDGRFYRYYLSAYDAKGETGPSKLVKAKTKDLPLPPADLLAESGLVKAVRLSWTPLKDPDVGGYFIYRGTQPEALKQIEKINSHTVGAYQDKGAMFVSLEDGATYHYVVSSFNLFGAEGKQTPAVTAKTKPRPVPVRGLSVKAEQQQISVNWAPNPEGDIQSYILSRSRNGGFWSDISTLDGDKNSFADSDLRPESEYRYRIIAQDKDGLQSDPVESDGMLSPIIKLKK
ncbi:MAG: fibronectin type III domain-containing protein [Desulfobacterales bacterium]|nr:fibronectin type III domain-containing protein [Desulfobacterales bacterium]